MDPNLPLRNVTTMEALVSEEMAPARFLLVLISVFAWIAVALAAAGLYGVSAHLVSGRKRELEICLALGAGGDPLVRMILRETARPILVGLAMGLGAALAGAAFLASYVPARQARRVDPVQALNAE